MAAPRGAARGGPGHRRLRPGGPWIGFGSRAGGVALVVGTDAAVRDEPADAGAAPGARDRALRRGALARPRPTSRRPSRDLSLLVRHLIADARPDGAAAASSRRRWTRSTTGWPADAVVAARLTAASSPGSDRADPVELVLAAARELTAGLALRMVLGAVVAHRLRCREAPSAEAGCRSRPEGPVAWCGPPACRC